MSVEAVKMISWETSVPEDVYLVLLSHGLSQEALAVEARKLLGVKLYATKILSLGKREGAEDCLDTHKTGTQSGDDQFFC